MNTIRIHKKLDSETLYLPELKPLIGRTVEITVEEQPSAAREEFYAEAACLPETEEALAAQKAIFRNWRIDPRFEAYWPVLDHLLARSFEQVGKSAAAAEAIHGLESYDFAAWREQREYDLKHASDHLP